MRTLLLGRGFLTVSKGCHLCIAVMLSLMYGNVIAAAEYDLYRTLSGASLTVIELDLQPIDSSGTVNDPTDDIVGDGIAETSVAFESYSGVFDVVDGNRAVYQAVSQYTDADTIIKRVINTATSNVDVKLVAISLKSVSPVSLIIDQGLSTQSNITVNIKLIGGAIAGLGGVSGSMEITGATGGTFVIPSANPSHPNSGQGMPAEAILKLTEVSNPSNVRDAVLFGHSLITQAATSWGSEKPSRDARVIPALADTVTGLPTNAFYPATTAGKLETLTLIEEDNSFGSYVQTLIPAVTIGSSVLTCFYECKPEQPPDFPATNPALQQTTTLMINNQNTPDATHSNTHIAHIVFFDGNENPLARADVSLSGHDVDELNVCATIDAANGTAREPSAGLIKIAVEDTALYQTQPSGAPYPAGIGVNATIKTLLGSFLPANPDPYDVANKVVSIDKTVCNATSNDVVTAEFYETTEIQAVPLVVPQLLDSTSP